MKEMYPKKPDGTCTGPCLLSECRFITQIYFVTWLDRATLQESYNELVHSVVILRRNRTYCIATLS